MDLSDQENEINLQADAFDDMNKFDSKHFADSSDEDRMNEFGPVNPKPRSAMEIMEEKYRLLMERLFKVEKQNTDYKETFDAIKGSQEEEKNKKIIDLSKKNRNLQVQVESLKNRASKAAEIAINLTNKHQGNIASPMKETNMVKQPVLLSSGDNQKLSKDLQEKVIKLRNENQHLSAQLDKAIRLLEREIGEVVDIDSLSKEESQWKGRAQKIDLLKIQIKKSSLQNDNVSMNSEYQPSFISKAEKNLSNMQGNKAKELEQLRMQAMIDAEEILQLKKKFSAANARKDTLEVQIKEIKQTFQSKIQILIEKTENDDKLIVMLKQEIARLEQHKGVKAPLKTGHTIQEAPTDELIRLRGENGRLKNQVKCSEIELQNKREKMEKMRVSGMNSEEDDPRLLNFQIQLQNMEENLRAVNRENARLMQNNAVPAKGGTGRDETEKMLNDITKSNAVLRRKLDDALEKIKALEKK